MLRLNSKTLLVGLIAVALLSPLSSAFACQDRACRDAGSYRNMVAYHPYSDPGYQPYYRNAAAYGGAPYGSGSWLRDLINPYGGNRGNYYPTNYNGYPPQNWGHHPCKWKHEDNGWRHGNRGHH